MLTIIWFEMEYYIIFQCYESTKLEINKEFTELYVCVS